MQGHCSCRWKVSSPCSVSAALSAHTSHSCYFSSLMSSFILERWTSVRFILWASTCSPATVTPIMVARWLKESSDASFRTTTFGKRWTSAARYLNIQESEQMGNRSINVYGLRLWSEASIPPWWSKTTCASRSFSSVAWRTWWVRWRRKGWTGIWCELVLPLQWFPLVLSSCFIFIRTPPVSFLQLYWSQENASGSPGEGRA